MNNIRQQQGIVLISVIIIVTLNQYIVTLAWEQHENFKLSKYTQTQQQALNYVYAIESWAKVILLDDKDTGMDDFEEYWAIEIPPISVFGSTVHGKITDLQATLSINNIVNTHNNKNVQTITQNGTFESCLNRLNEQLEQMKMSDLIFTHR